jgi:hypothetical protein
MPPTGAQAIEQYAKVTGIPVVRVDRVARVQKRQVPSLWPKSGQGGGRRAQHVRVDHLVNLTIALATADPFTAAPKFIAMYRSLLPEAPARSRSAPLTTGLTATVTEFLAAGDDKLIDPFATGDFALNLKLGEHLEIIALMLSSGAGFDPALREHHRRHWACDLHDGAPGIAPSATITSMGFDGAIWVRRFLSPEQPSLGLDAPARPRAPLLRSTRISFALLEVIGEILGDTQAETAAAGGGT